MFSCYIRANVSLWPFIWTWALTSLAVITHLLAAFQKQNILIQLQKCTLTLRAKGKRDICIWYQILAPASTWSSCLLLGRLPFHVRTPVLQVCCCLFTPVGSWGGRWRAYTISSRLTAGENVYEINMGLMQCSEPCSAVALEASCIIPPPPLPLFLLFPLSFSNT